MSDERKLRGADIVARTLEAAAIEKIFTLSGNHIMAIFDATIDTSLELIHVRHEAAAVHMADAWSRLTAQIGVALVTGGPGHANAVSALYTAMASESPLLLLSGHAPLERLGQGAFQEMEQADLAAPVSKASWVAKCAEAIEEDIAEAIRIARSGRPGPVHLSLPVDILEAFVDEPATPVRSSLPRFWPCRHELRADTARMLVGELARARRPLILAGPMMTNVANKDALKRLRAAIRVPVVTLESPRGVNDPKLGAFAQLLEKSDYVVLLGKKPDFTLGFAGTPPLNKNCQIVYIGPAPIFDAYASNLLSERRYPVKFIGANPADATELLALTATDSASCSTSPWFERVEAAITYRPEDWKALSSNMEGRLHPVEVCREVRNIFDEYSNATLVVDGGEFGQWSQACVDANARVINGPAGSIGSAIPFAIAAGLARGDAPVVAMLGDGTAGFHLCEFDTAARYKVPFIAIIGSDACWNAEYQIQLRSYGLDRAVGCELAHTHYEKAVEALGGYGEHVTSRQALRKALQRAISNRQPTCINVPIIRTPAPVVRSSDFGECQVN